MTPDHLILTGLLVLVTAVFVLIVKKGTKTRPRMCVGFCALLMLSVLAIGLHCYLQADTTIAEFGRSTASFQGIGLDILFVAVASVGLLYAAPSE